MLTKTEDLYETICRKCGDVAVLQRLTLSSRKSPEEKTFIWVFCQSCWDRRLEKINELAAMPRFPEPHRLHDLLWDIQDGKCIYCGAPLIDGIMHLDHIVVPCQAYDRGLISEAPSNYTLACPQCNISKSNRWYIDWIEWKFKDKAAPIINRVQNHIAIMLRDTGEDEWRKSIGIISTLEYKDEP